MFRLVGLLPGSFLAASFISLSAMAQTIGCTSQDGQVSVEVAPVYNNTMVRVTTREVQNGQPLVVLNDLMKHPEQQQGIFQNHLMRLQVLPKSMSRSLAQKGHIDFLYDTGIRASYDLICTTR
jgi:hypothetical protein